MNKIARRFANFLWNITKTILLTLLSLMGLFIIIWLTNNVIKVQ